MVPQQAQAEKLTLLVAENSSGNFGVTLNNPGQPKRYQAQVRRGRRGGKDVGISAEVFLSRRARAGPPLYAYAVRRSPQGDGPVPAARHGIQGGGRDSAHAAATRSSNGSRCRRGRQGGGALG